MGKIDHTIVHLPTKTVMLKSKHRASNGRQVAAKYLTIPVPLPVGSMSSHGNSLHAPYAPALPPNGSVAPPPAMHSDFLQVQGVHGDANEHNFNPMVPRSNSFQQQPKAAADQSGRFNCTVVGCPKVCANTSHLKYHLATHTGEKSYACPHCRKAFTSQSNLNAHRKRSHFESEQGGFGTVDHQHVSHQQHQHVQQHAHHQPLPSQMQQHQHHQQHHMIQPPHLHHLLSPPAPPPHH